MEKKVIKFNLVGAIFVIILIISIIVGIVIIATKSKNKNNDYNSNNQLEKIEGIIDEEKEIKENVIIQGTKREIIMKTCKGSYGYTMKYDVNSFYVEKDANGMDKFNSLYSDTVNISVLKSSGNYEDEIERLKLNSNIIDTEKYEIEEKVVNGLNINIKKENKPDEKNYTYYIKSYDGYFVVQVNCGLEFEDIVWPIIEKMIESFEIL